MPGPLALRGPRCTFRKNACDVTGSGDTFDGGHRNVSHDTAKTVQQGDRIAKEGGRELNDEGLHVKRLQAILNNVHVGIPKMNIVQEESLRDQKKIRRRAQILEIARGLISSKGLRSLKVRDIAGAADCSIGSVYNEFGDFDGVILTVNRETVSALTARLAAVPKDDPIRQLHGLAATYLDFAAEHPNLLRSLFEHRMEQDRPFPEDILVMVMDAFNLMHEPFERLMPGRNPEDVALLSRMMFSAVHGIISLGLEERMVAVPPESLRHQVAQFVDTHLVGLGILKQANA
jgi:AcrR family transcriptional regulator